MSEYKGNGERRDRNINEEDKFNRKKIKEGKKMRRTKEDCKKKKRKTIKTKDIKEKGKRGG
jgi:hypothetical protein